MIGTTLSHYRITEKLGEGGTGEVHRAECTSLSQKASIRVIPDRFVRDVGPPIVSRATQSHQYDRNCTEYEADGARTLAAD